MKKFAAGVPPFPGSLWDKKLRPSSSSLFLFTCRLFYIAFPLLSRGKMKFPQKPIFDSFIVRALRARGRFLFCPSALGPPRPQTPGDFSRGRKVTKRPLKGAYAPLRIPNIAGEFIFLRFSCGLFGLNRTSGVFLLPCVYRKKVVGTPYRLALGTPGASRGCVTIPSTALRRSSRRLPLELVGSRRDWRTEPPYFRQN